MKTLKLKLGIVAAFFMLVATILPPVFLPKVSAVSASDWNAARIIDDSVFFNPNTMSADDIQTFLNAKVPNCTGSNPTCLKSYTQAIPTVNGDAYCSTINGSGGSAYNVATIIKIVTAACDMNPQAMLVLIQKEQGLVTSTAPTNYMYQFATGFCVYDTTPPPACAGTDGFFNQIYYGARQFQKYAKNLNDFNFAAGRTSNIQYSPNASCGSSPVAIQNAATAGLYNYTPYQPNQASLNAGYGTGDGCSSYGNRNFWRYFWDWFGNPIGTEYAWLIDSFTYSGGDNILTVGYDETVTLKARNVGRQPWYNHGDHPIRLGTWEPPNRSSSILPIRPATMQESVVQPNQVGTFQFQLNPANPGVYVESLNLVAENYAWMSWPGFRPTIVVSSSPYQWQIDDVVYGTGTGVMNPDSRQLITVKAKNTGNVTWSKTGGNPVRLATWGPGRQSGVYDSSDWLNSIRATDMNENSVAPGQVAGFQFYVHMPGSGNFYEQMNLVAEGVSWFNDPGLVLYLHGRTYAWQPVWQSLSTGNANIGRNQTFDITVRVRNTGEMAWKKTDPFKVRFATDDPQNRGSGFYTPSWINDTRPTSLVEDVVNPGQEGTFTFNSRAPNSPGGRYEYFSLVAEGIEWFNDPGFNVYINVL